MPMAKVRKAVFPAAGLGTRFLPATKAMPKEMLPLVDKPIIQYGVEEAMAAGCDQIVIITGRGKTAIEDQDRKSTRLNSSHRCISYAVFCLKKKKNQRKKPLDTLVHIVHCIGLHSYYGQNGFKE